MTTVIKGGTIVTADMTYASDVLIDNGVITAIGKDLKGDKVARRLGLLRHARRHRSAHPSRNALHGHHRLRGFLVGHPGRRSPAAPPWWSISSCPIPTSR